MNNEDITKIVPYLYISNWDTSNNPEIIDKYNIKAVITLETMDKSLSILSYYNAKNIDFMYIYIYDNENVDISKYFDSTFNFIEKHIAKKENVLVHCYAGISRSPTIVLNYIIRDIYQSKNIIKPCACSVVDYVLNVVKKKRPINPNEGFMKQLLLKTQEYERNIS